MNLILGVVWILCITSYLLLIYPFILYINFKCYGIEYQEFIIDKWNEEKCTVVLLVNNTSFPDSSVGRVCLQCRRPRFNSWVRRICWRRNRYPLQYSWASLVAQLVKNPPAMWETWVQSLGWEDPLEKGKATHSSILAWRIPWTIQSMGRKELDTTKRLSLSPLMVLKLLILKIKTFKTFPLFDFIELFILS